MKKELKIICDEDDSDQDFSIYVNAMDMYVAITTTRELIRHKMKFGNIEKKDYEFFENLLINLQVEAIGFD